MTPIGTVIAIFMEAAMWSRCVVVDQHGSRLV